MIRVTLIFFSVLLLLAIASTGWLLQEKERQLHSPIKLGEKINFSIKNGSNLKSVLLELSEKGIIKNPYYLLFEARQKKKAALIKAGEYEIHPGTTQMQLLDQFIAGKVIQYSLTLVEGWNFKQVMEAIRQHNYIKQSLADKNQEEIMAMIDCPGLNPEGQFFPDTYHFPVGTSDVEFLQRAQQNLHRVLDDEWENKEENLPYKNAYEALIMASIIEKETGAAEERNKIAGVFVRRLEINMKLQTDPTVIYSLGEQYDGNIRRKDLKFDSPYNTYVYKGLPPTPIALAGREAINAALHPQEGKSLYFVSMGNGKHYFSETLKEHNRAVRKYQLKK